MRGFVELQLADRVADLALAGRTGGAGDDDLVVLDPTLVQATDVAAGLKEGDQFALLEGRIALLEMARSSRLVPVRSGIPRARPRATYRPAGPVTSFVRSAS